MTRPDDTPAAEQPLADFSQCHAGILRKLDGLEELPALLAPAARARELAECSVEFFREAIFEHHLDEERELFPAVLTSATPEERGRLQAIVRRLTDEHRALESLWKRLEGDLKRVAKGQAFEVDTEALQTLVSQYRAHARYEEETFLPLAQAILGRNGDHMAALGLALHVRHTPMPVPAYV